MLIMNFASNQENVMINAQGKNTGEVKSSE